MTDTNLTADFMAKVDAFAATLEPEEQAMFAELLTEDNEVAGFGGHGTGWGGPGWKWPGLTTLRLGNVQTTASGSPSGLIAHEMTHFGDR